MIGDETGQAIGDQQGVRGQRLLGPLHQHLAGEAGHRIQAHVLWRPFLLAGLHRDHKWHLVLGATPNFAGMDPTEIRIMDFHPLVQDTIGLTLIHHLHQLVLPAPGRLVAHPLQALELQGRDVVLRLGEVTDPEKLQVQRQACRFKDRARRQRCLPAASPALPQPSLVAMDQSMFASAAMRTEESLRPARQLQRRFTLGLRPELSEKARQGEALLEPELVARHFPAPGCFAPPKVCSRARLRPRARYGS